MPIKGEGPATDWREIDRWEGGTGWIAYPKEGMQRASHALFDDGDVWLVDPVDVEGLDEYLADFGEVAGVVVLIDRHTRDAGKIARRHGVAVHVPEWMTGVEENVDAPVERVHGEVGETSYEMHKLIDNALWQEAFLYDEASGTLVVAEALATNHFSRTRDERLGVQVVLRLTPPKRLGRLSPERILVGHGEGILEDAAAALREALAGSRRRAPKLWAKNVRELLT
ncbi:MAG: hypothetical protein ABEJ85_05895 [Haloarculaceae archaeon]